MKWFYYVCYCQNSHTFNPKCYLVDIHVISEKVMAPHSSTLAWKIPWAEEPGRLQSKGSLRIEQDWETSLSLSCIGEGNGNPLQCFAWRIPGTGEPGGLPSMGSHRVGYDWGDLAAAAAAACYFKNNKRITLCGRLISSMVANVMNKYYTDVAEFCSVRYMIHLLLLVLSILGLRYLSRGGTSGKEPACQCRHKRYGFNSWVRKIPWRRAWQPPPIFLPGESSWTEEPGGLQSIMLQNQTWLEWLSSTRLPE